MTETKVDPKGQVYMTEADTPLSNAADAFLEADAAIVLAKDKRETAMHALMDEMKNIKKNSITHNGQPLTVRRGHVTKDVISFSRG